MGSSWLFRLQKYKKFESNSQQLYGNNIKENCCFDCKSTKNLRAIHNSPLRKQAERVLFRLQKYKKFESNSQHSSTATNLQSSCFDCKSTKNLRAIHNELVYNYIKVTLFRLQKYKKFESNSQPEVSTTSRAHCCFDCKSTKNLRAIHNEASKAEADAEVVSTAKVQKI